MVFTIYLILFGILHDRIFGGQQRATDQDYNQNSVVEVTQIYDPVAEFAHPAQENQQIKTVVIK